MNYEVVQVDAFTSQPLEGNSCAIYPEAQGLTDDQMQRIAREMNLSETSYVLPSGRADFRVRYFTPTSEIPMAGHPTVATVHALCDLRRIAPDVSRVTLEMPAGIIPVTIDRDHAATRYIMQQLPPKFMRTYSHAAIAAALDLSEGDLLAEVAPQTVSTGTPQLMVALRDVDALARIHGDVRKLFHDVERDYFSVHVFARERDGDTLLCSRHFADFNGLIEDPFTGSASGSMAAYCARYRLVDCDSYKISQGRHAGRPGVGYIRVLGSPDNIEGIDVGGEAVTVLRGTLLL
jgi:trans-2,3-dihydro-3-hydroxyanthranilate isomerase